MSLTADSIGCTKKEETVFKTEKQFQVIGLDPRSNEGIEEIQRDWTHFPRRQFGIRSGY